MAALPCSTLWQLLVLLFFALKGSVRHFRGDGSCCSGGSSCVRTEEKHLDGPVVAEWKVSIDGMKCERCAENIKRAIESIDGAAASVDFRRAAAVVRMDRTVDETLLRRKIKEAGYSVTSIETS